ncbi:MAG: RtcB family protein [Chloroflexia bacterium]|nr:RtcB family protein [Chloroflexia bacterium]
MGIEEYGLVQVDDYRWEIPKSEGMRVPARIYADRKMMTKIADDRSPQQVRNVAHLPGIVGYSMAMPDIHWGYGFPIGGVAATDPEKGGVVSPGGVGYDINCGVRLVRSDLTQKDVEDKIHDLVAQLHRDVPAGVGSRGDITADLSRAKGALVKGVRWAVEQGYGWTEDVEYCEDGGAMEGADPDIVQQYSPRALERGRRQLGTLGSGNHFVEISVVETVFNPSVAATFGLFEGQIVLQIHSGSRGFGHQICDDFLKVMGEAARKYNISLPDRQLACAPAKSKEGQHYMRAMACAANYAWVNRQCLMHLAREALAQALHSSARSLGLRLVYDVAHNIAKVEKHLVDGEERILVVHRKGATRAFPAGRSELPQAYRDTGHPVLVPGDMGRASYVLVGQPLALEETWGSSCHGAGRLLSRKGAIRRSRDRNIRRELAEKGIVVMATQRNILGEEMPEAYKDVSDVVNVMHGAGLANKVVRLRPLGVVKG